ncbi:hypothetical protein GGR52DRAFT_71330 [Hypoxylon sp. FL1284]|nr:hypothetical protein GGR52DRAFT_71330 [Hypoxylon sp. FL1284]
MGRLEPLTSLALGRSPYDDAVPGEGEADPHEPEKKYDGTGRIVNPSTKKIIKDVIRAHNEVMQVIGVAEHESGENSLADLETTKMYHDYETDTGNTLYQIGSSLGIVGTWGVLSIRRRILVYKKSADVSFLRLLQTEYNSHSLFRSLLAGYPSNLVKDGLHVAARNTRRPWVHGIIHYVRFHLQIFLTMQRLDLIPASRWLPGITFFIPFSSSSPFSAPPLPASFDISSVSSWAAQLIANLAPYASFYVYGVILHVVCYIARLYIRERLPRPYPSSRVLPQPVPESPTLGTAEPEMMHQSEETVHQIGETVHQSEETVYQPAEDDAPTSLALDAPSSGEPIPVGTIRRQSTISSRGGEDYGTDDEESEMVNPTLISFDVDTSDSTEPSSGVWSAELRPTYAGDLRQQPKETPVYINNPLTNLPSRLAADILAQFAANISTVVLESHTLPFIARAFASKRGLPYGDMVGGGLLGGLTWQRAFNVIRLDIVRLLIFGEVWGLTTMLSQWLHVSEEEWKLMQKENEEEKAMCLLN